MHKRSFSVNALLKLNANSPECLKEMCQPNSYEKYERNVRERKTKSSSSSVDYPTPRRLEIALPFKELFNVDLNADLAEFDCTLALPDISIDKYDNLSVIPILTVPKSAPEFRHKCDTPFVKSPLPRTADSCTRYANIELGTKQQLNIGKKCHKYSKALNRQLKKERNPNEEENHNNKTIEANKIVTTVEVILNEVKSDSIHIIKNSSNEQITEVEKESFQNENPNANLIELFEETSTSVITQPIQILPKDSPQELNTQSAQVPPDVSSEEIPQGEIPTTETNTSTEICNAKKLTKELSQINYFCNRRTWITTEHMNELRRKAQEAVKQNKTFTIRGCFNSVRNALMVRGWVEKLDAHRKHVPNGICQVTYDDLAQGLPKRKPGETRRAYISKCDRNIMSRFLEHMPIDFLWTNRKEKCDYIDQAKNPGMVINKFHRAPFTTKEGLCNQLKEFHWFYEEGTAEMYFPRCFNVWSPEELCDFVENYKLTACIAFIRYIVNNYHRAGFETIFSPIGKIPYSAIEFAYKRCIDFIECCQHNDIDIEDPPKIWEHDWDAFLYQHYLITNEDGKILADPQRNVEPTMKSCAQLLLNIQEYWPQYSLDGYRNLWIVKPANKCRGRGIQLMDNLKKIMSVVNPAITSKSRYVVQKYIERPLIIHHTKFDIRQWFLITNVQPLVIWMYKESYLRFSSQEYSLTNHHESVHLTNYAIQKKYTNGKRDRRLPNENMWDCYSFQAYLRQIGRQDMWHERIYPGMRKAIIGTMLASQDNMDRRPNTFELFGADFMICEDFYPWLIEINSSPDLGATTSVTARMCPQCLEDVIKVVIDRRLDPKADLGNFELIYRQVVPPTPAYMGLNLFIKGKQISTKINHHHNGYFNHHHHRRERSLNTSQLFRQRTALIPTVSIVHKPIMPTFNATELLEKTMAEALNSSRSSLSGTGSTGTIHPVQSLSSARIHRSVPAQATPCPNLLRTTHQQVGVRRRSFTNLSMRRSPHGQKLDEMLKNEDLNNLPTKRHRSCGPSLIQSYNAENNEKKFKFFIRQCNIAKQMNRIEQKSQHIAGTKSEDECDKDKSGSTKGRQSKREIKTQTTNTYNRSQSCIYDGKYCRRMFRAAQNDDATNNSNSMMASKNAPTKTTSISTASLQMHAIGRGLNSWKFNRKRSAAKTPIISYTKAAANKVIGCDLNGSVSAVVHINGVGAGAGAGAGAVNAVDKEAPLKKKHSK